MRIVNLISMSKRKVSVIITVRNGEKYIKEAIGSVLVQSFQDFELIIVDDGSTDNTLQQVASFPDSRIRIIRRSHDYIGSLNAGLQQSQGEYIAILDHDDLMMPKRLETQVKAMDTFKQLTVCGGKVSMFKDGHLSHARLMPLPYPGLIKHPLWFMLKGNFINNPTVMIRSTFLKDKGIRYDPGYPFAPDFKLWLDIARQGGTFFLLDTPLTYYRISPSQMSHALRDRQRENAFAIRQQALEDLLKTTDWGNKSIDMHRWNDELQRMKSTRLLTDEDMLHVYYMVFKNFYLSSSC